MNHLHNAVRKCSHNFKREWYGYLLPKEILALRDLGIKLDSRYVDHAIYWKRHGISGGMWTYFDIHKGIEKKWRTLKDGTRRS